MRGQWEKRRRTKAAACVVNGQVEPNQPENKYTLHSFRWTILSRASSHLAILGAWWVGKSNLNSVLSREPV